MSKFALLFVSVFILVLHSGATHLDKLALAKTGSKSTSHESAIQQYEQLTSKHLNIFQKWAFRLSQHNLFATNERKENKSRFILKGFLLSFLGGLFVFSTFLLVFSGVGGAYAVGLLASALITGVVSLTNKNKDLGHSALLGLLAYLGVGLVGIIIGIIALISCGCMG